MTRSRRRLPAQRRPGLRARFLLAMLALVLVVLGGFVYAVSEFLDVLENDMVHGELMRDMERVAKLYERDPALLQVTEPSLRVFVTPHGDTAGLPNDLADLDNGRPREVRLPDAEYEYGATRRDIGDKSLYVLHDLAPVERLEKELIGVAWIAGLSALFLAVVLGLWLSQLVVWPVHALAAQVSRVAPGQQRPSLRAATGDRQLDVIIEAFDDVLDRFDAFVAREQAFTEDASHELRTPLATTISSLDLIAQDSTLSAKSRTRLMRARQAAARMQELIESLLLFAREETGHDYRTPVSPVVREAIAMQQAFSGTDAAAPDIAFDARGEHHVAAPQSMLLSVVSNLLRNAIAHGRSGETQRFSWACVCANHELVWPIACVLALAIIWYG